MDLLLACRLYRITTEFVQMGDEKGIRYTSTPSKEHSSKVYPKNVPIHRNADVFGNPFHLRREKTVTKRIYGSAGCKKRRKGEKIWLFSTLFSEWLTAHWCFAKSASGPQSSKNVEKCFMSSETENISKRTGKCRRIFILKSC